MSMAANPSAGEAYAPPPPAEPEIPKRRNAELLLLATPADEERAPIAAKLLCAGNGMPSARSGRG